MFRWLGRSVTRGWPLWLLGWAAVIAAATLTAPPLKSVLTDGEFGFLPDSSPSRRGEKLLAAAFPDETNDSSVVLVLSRSGDASELTDTDLAFVDDVLKPRFERVQEQLDAGPVRIAKIRTHRDEMTGPLLASVDRRAMLVVVELTSDFLDLRNRAVVRTIEDAVAELRTAGEIPSGLDVAFTGSATVGRDMSQAKSHSARMTELVTIGLVVLLLGVIYRSPLLALIPLGTVFLSVHLSLKLLSLLAERGVIGLFDGIQTFVTVIVYGAGVDYCLFLTARYREELDAGVASAAAMERTLANVGSAITASAGTVIGGIGMMVFAAFGKFQQAGIGIAFSLVVVLLATLTLTASVLRLAGRRAFWPQRIALGATGGMSARASPEFARPGSKLPVAPGARLPLTPNPSPQRGEGGVSSLLQSLWEKVAARLLRSPGLILIVSVAALLPFSILGWQTHNRLSYGLITNLPADAPSVVGTRALQAHFPAGFTGPTSVLVRSDSTDFSDSDGAELIGRLTNWLSERGRELALQDVRSRAQPLGITEAASAYLADVPPARRIALQGVLRKRARDHYVSRADGLGGKVTQFDLVFALDPFARESISHLDRVERAVREEFPKQLPADAALQFVGPTASIRDLKDVRASDQVRIGVLVCVSIFAILIVLLRRPVVSLYLIGSVLLSYLTAFGATYAVFWMLDPSGFPGLDWKLPMLLFTILVAVGEDYNIFLMSRIEEEQRRHGPVQGVTVALAKTGRIISSCGLIMAGTFAALIAGSLASMRQLGFALAFGVLLDTFVVRPVLVPAFLILLHRRGRVAPALVPPDQLAG